MGIVVIIVGGIVVVSLISVMGDYMSKVKRTGDVDPSSVRELKNRITALEKEAEYRDSRMARMEDDIAFTTKLLEGKHEPEH